MLQWSEGNVLNNATINLSNFTSYLSVSDIGMNFVTQPEATLSGCNPLLNYQQALALFDSAFTESNQVSLLNPLNLKYFLTDTMANKSAIMTRFGLTSE